MPTLSHEIIAKAESFPGIKAGIARLEDVLQSPSYKVVPDGKFFSSLSNEATVIEWPSKAKSILVLGLHHPEDNPRLDWWDRGNTMGNRLLMDISDSLKQWLKEEYGLLSLPLPYHVESGGLFLKDAAVIAGLGVIGRSNLLLNPEWGPCIRFRSILIEGELKATKPIDEEFFPCESCSEICHSACPQNVFSTGTYCKPDCIAQINTDITNKMHDEEVDQDRAPRLIIKYCRACEFACPAGE
jgi:epoxyqueuosine reductase